jgi:hypothetical protein
MKLSHGRHCNSKYIQVCYWFHFLQIYATCSAKKLLIMAMILICYGHLFWQLNVSGRPDENILVEVMGPLSFSSEDTVQKRTVVYLNLHKGQLKVTASYHHDISTSLEVNGSLVSIGYGVFFVSLKFNLYFCLDLFLVR